MAKYEAADDSPYKMQDLAEDLKARGVERGSWTSFRSVVAEAVGILEDVRSTRERTVFGNALNFCISRNWRFGGERDG